MADYSSLIASIEAVIRENGNNEITGPILQSVLKSMLTAINNTKADIVSVPTQLSQLGQTVNYRTVSDAEKAAWNAKSQSGFGTAVTPYPGQPNVDNYVGLYVVNNGTQVQYNLALSNHSHEWSDIHGLSEKFEDYVTVDDLGFTTGVISPSQVNVDSFFGLQVYDETKYFALRNHTHSYNNLTDKPALPTFQQRGDHGHPIYFDEYSQSKLIDYLAIHPEEADFILIPFLFSDISFLLEKGGTCTVQASGLSWTDGDKERLFDSAPSYFIFTRTISGQVTVTIDITLPQAMYWNNYLYIDFGSTAWYAKSVTAQWGLNTLGAAQTQIISVSFARFKIEAGSSGFNRIRFSLSDWVAGSVGSQVRIAEIGVLNFNGLGLRASAMSRGYNDPVYRHITPGKDAQYVLGTSGAQWAEFWLARTLYLGGNIFITQWTDDIVINQYNASITPTKRLRFFGAIVGGVAHAFQDDAGNTLLNLGTENVSSKDFRGNNNTRKLGTSAIPWGEIHGNKWFPVANDLGHYIEYINNRFLIHGSLAVTGYISSGELGSETTEQRLTYNLNPSNSATYSLGTASLRWLNGYFTNLFAQKLGSAGDRVDEAYINTLYANRAVISGETVTWDDFSNYIGTTARPTLSQFGATAQNINDIVSGVVKRVAVSEWQGAGDVTHYFNVTEVETDSGTGNVTIYLGRKLILQQIDSTQWRFYNGT